MSRARKSDSERDEAIARLREWIKPGDTIYTVLRHVSRSGMQREIDLRKVGEDGEIMWLSGMAARAMGDRLGKRDGIVVGGCGMDMGFHLVYNLSRVLFKGGFGCIGKAEHGAYPGPRQWCPSNDHSNGRRDYSIHGRCTENPVTGACNVIPCPHGAANWHSNGGYALRHAWI